MKLFITFLFVNALLSAYVDSDMDGVPDKNDKCINTPLTDLVNLSGCTIKQLQTDEKYFNLVLGQSYVDTGLSTLYLSSLKINYYDKNWSIQLASSYYDSSLDIENSRGQNDTYLTLYYFFDPINNLYLTLSAGLVFPTYDIVNNNMDYTASFYGRYKFYEWSFIVGLGYNKIGDIDALNTFDYQNKFSYNVGVGYTWDSGLYASFGYYRTNSTSNIMEDLQTISVYAYYPFNEHWFASLNYGDGFISNIKRKNVGINIGYYW